jgi:hypothetical protein
VRRPDPPGGDRHGQDRDTIAPVAQPDTLGLAVPRADAGDALCRRRLALGRTIWFSFTDASLDLMNEARWVGFRNYLEYVDFGDGEGQYYGLLADARWWRSVWNTILFAVVSVSFETVFGLIIALVLHQQFVAAPLCVLQC